MIKKIQITQTISVNNSLIIGRDSLINALEWDKQYY